ncbi:MAG: beta-ketoacyl synthase chain length factor [Stenotrophobium sp.]
MKPLFIESVGLAAPGLAGWAASVPVLRGEQPYAAQEMNVYQPALLPPNERRRATAAVRLAFRVCEDAMSRSEFPPAELAGVFASSEADTGILHRLCTALADDARAVSPTDFHNSVHNAAAGYWSIAAGAKLPSVSLSAYDASFVVGLLEATTLAHGDGCKVLLAAYDICPPEPLYATRPLTQPFGVALVLTPQRSTRALACVEVAPTPAAETVMADAALESLRIGNPAGRALPLLERLAWREPGDVILPGTGTQRWRLRVQPCA